MATDGVPLLGTVPVYGGNKHTRRFRSAPRTLVRPSSPAAESYHTLATSLRFSSIGKEKRTILVTSSSGGEGKTTVTANLAAVLAESGLRVVVVSADLRRPMLGELLGVPDNQKGLTSAMLGDSDLSSCFVSVTLPSGKSLFVLPAGPLPHEPSVLLGSDMFGTVLDQIKQAGADFILIDCAPVLPVSDPLAASRHVDGVIVLVAARQDQDRQPAPDGRPACGRSTPTSSASCSTACRSLVATTAATAATATIRRTRRRWRWGTGSTRPRGRRAPRPPRPPGSNGTNGFPGTSGGNGSGKGAESKPSDPATKAEGYSETGKSSAERNPEQG